MRPLDELTDFGDPAVATDPRAGTHGTTDVSGGSEVHERGDDTRASLWVRPHGAPDFQRFTITFVPARQDSAWLTALFPSAYGELSLVDVELACTDGRVQVTARRRLSSFR